MKLEKLDTCLLCGDSNLVFIDIESNLCKCLSCGYIFDNPRPTLNELIKFYSKPTKYDSWLSEESARDLLWKRRLKKMEKTKKNGTILDVGTGIGQFLFHAKKSYTKVYGTEISKSAVNIAKNKYGLVVYESTLEDLNLKNLKFDNITLFHVLEHVPDPATTIKKIKTLLCPGGVLVIAVPNEIYSFKKKIKIFLRSMGIKKFKVAGKFDIPKIQLNSLDEVHLSHFTPEVLVNFLEKSGFVILKNSCDPYYSLIGIKKFKEDCYYTFCSVFNFLFKKNIYDTTWVVVGNRL